jgi:hypothetical protein
MFGELKINDDDDDDDDGELLGESTNFLIFIVLSQLEDCVGVFKLKK